MSKYVVKNARLFTGAADLTGMTNKVELTAEVEEKDATTFGSVDASGELWKEVLGGLKSGKLAASGFWEAADASKVDDAAFAALGGVGPWTVCPKAGAVGDVAYVASMLTASYTLGGQVGDIAPYSASGVAAWPIGRGQVLHPPGTARTATGSGTAAQVGAVAAGKYLYANLHVLSIAGTSTPTLTVKVQSDDNAGFTSATDRITFTAATAIGGQASRVAGAITDDYWRVVWTISGTSPSFLFAAAVGIA